MKTNKINPARFWSIVSGTSLLVMALAAAYAYGFSLSTLYVDGDSAQTLLNIDINPFLYYSSIGAWCLILLTDIVVSYGFYMYFKDTHNRFAKLSSALRLLYAAFLAAGISFLMGRDIKGFLDLWSMGLIVFGLHLAATGFIVLLDSRTPSLLGIFLLTAGISYMLIHGLDQFIPQAAATVSHLERILTLPMAAGELLFALWLLIRGGKNLSLPLSAVSGSDGL